MSVYLYLEDGARESVSQLIIDLYHRGGLTARLSSSLILSFSLSDVVVDVINLNAVFKKVFLKIIFRY